MNIKLYIRMVAVIAVASLLGGETLAQLTLTANRTTGEVTISNDTAAAVDLDGFQIASGAGSLAAASLDFDGFGPGWENGPNTANSVAQLFEGTMASTFDTLAAGGSVSLASSGLFTPITPAFFQQQVEDLAFTYTGPGVVVPGVVEYVGNDVPLNDIVLTVNTTTGAVSILNESSFTQQIDAYRIQSASSSLSLTGWNSLADQGIAAGDWSESAISTNGDLLEVQEAGATTFDNTTQFNIGNPFDTGVGVQDLTFEFLLAGDTQLTSGIVVYEAGATGLLCDLDADGDCDPTDIDLLYATSPGVTEIADWLSQASDPANPYKTSIPGGTASDVYVLGDVNLNGDVDSADLGLLLNNFNDASGVGWSGGDLNADQLVDSGDLGLLLNNFNFNSAAASAVPEPGSLSLLGMAGFVALLTLRRKK